MLIVSRLRRNRSDVAARFRTTLESANAPLIGVVANGFKRARGTSYGYGYGYSYDYTNYNGSGLVRSRARTAPPRTGRRHSRSVEPAFLAMKQVSLRLRDGRVDVFDVPPPMGTPYTMLVDVRASLLSVGTERSRLEAAREGLIGKGASPAGPGASGARQGAQDGLRETVNAVRRGSISRRPRVLGGRRCHVGRRAGPGVRARRSCRVRWGRSRCPRGCRVGPGKPLCRAPEAVPFEAGAFATVASVAMHGVRQADVRIGEGVAVIGLGLVGQLTGQILRAAGCRVVGIDLVDSLVEKARQLRSVDVAYNRDALVRLGIPPGAADCDAVIVTAATRSADPIELAARLLRDRGRVVVVGDAHVEVPRAPYYEREIDIRFSRSYGPGRYDREYEERGLDYPIGYVRWTEQRNMAAFLDLVAQGRIDLGGLISERMPVERAAEAYERLLGGGGLAPGDRVGVRAAPRAWCDWSYHPFRRRRRPTQG